MLNAASSKAPPTLSVYFPATFLLVVGSAIATIAGFDSAFNAGTRGSPWLRALLFAALTLVGLLCAKKAGLSLLPKRVGRCASILVAIGFAMAAYVVIIDLVIFRAIVPEAYVVFIQEQTLGLRLIYLIFRTFNEEIFYRLILMSAIVCALHLASRARDRAIPDGFYWVAIVGAQIFAISLNVVALLPASHLTPIFWLYLLLRFIAPGIAWGYLYWRHGLVSAQIAHVSTHIFLQPVLGYAFGSQ